MPDGARQGGVLLLPRPMREREERNQERCSTGSATRLLGGQGARRGGGEGPLQGESVGGGEVIRSRERQTGESTGVGRNRAVNVKDGGRRR